MLYLRTLGGLSLDPNGHALAGPAIPRGRLAILAVLAVAGDRGVSRDRLLALFWPESDEERARGALKQATFQLRRSAGSDELLLGTTELRLNPSVIGADIIDFEEAIRSGDPERALASYAGSYLDGIHLADNSVFAHWVDQERNRIGQAHRTALETLARSADSRADRPSAVRWWREVARADPLSGAAAVGLMHALVAAGDAPAALRYARIHETRVREDLGADPDPVVFELVRSIRDATLDRDDDPVRRTSAPAEPRAQVTAAPETPRQPEAASVPRSRWREPSRWAVLTLVLVALIMWRKPFAGAISAVRDRAESFLAVRVDPRFKHWSHAAAMPRSADALRQLGLGIEAFQRASSSRPGATLEKAITHFMASASLDTTSATPLLWSALSYSWIGRSAEAESVLVALGGSTRRFGPWDRALVDVLRARAAGDLAGAHEASHRLAIVVPDSEWLLLLAWDALSVGRAREATEILSRLDPERGWLAGEPRYWITLSVANHLLEDFEAELREARRALDREPDNRLYIQLEVKALAALGRDAEVEARCERALTLRAEPRTIDYQPCGQAMSELWAHGRVDAARRIAASLVRAYSTGPQAELDIAYILLEARDIEGAARVLGRHRPEELENPEYVEVVTWIAAAQGDRAGAIRGLERLDELARRGLGIIAIDRQSFRRAEVAAYLGDRDEAVSWLTRAFRQGLFHRAPLHIIPAFDGMKDYPPFQALQRPVEDEEPVRH